MCGKRGYDTEHEAQVALVSAILARNRGKNQRRERRYYQCPSCHRWVLTSKTIAQMRAAGLVPDAKPSS